jgi:hypothetical protein
MKFWRRRPARPADLSYHDALRLWELIHTDEYTPLRHGLTRLDKAHSLAEQLKASPDPAIAALWTKIEAQFETASPTFDLLLKHVREQRQVGASWRDYRQVTLLRSIYGLW